MTCRKSILGRVLNQTGGNPAKTAVFLIASLSSANCFAFPTDQQIWAGGLGNWSDAANWMSISELSSSMIFGEVLLDDGNIEQSSVLLDLDVSIGSLVVDPQDSLHVQNAWTLTIGIPVAKNSVHNGGLIRLLGSDLPARLVVGVPELPITGNGILELTSAAQSQVIGIRGTEHLSIVSQTVCGAGLLGGGTLSITNFGTIDANLFEQVLTVDPNALGLVNSGQMRAREGGRLLLTGGTFDNSLGAIESLDASQVNIEGATVVGGVLSTAGNGIIQTHLTPSTLNSVTLNGFYELGPVKLTLQGSITNNGWISAVSDQTFTGDVAFSEIAIPASSGTVSLLGDGQLSLKLTKIYSGSASPGGKLVNGPGHVIHGEGLLGYNTIGFTNQGVVEADEVFSLVIDPIDSQVVVNTGTMRAIGPQGLILTGGQFRNDGVLEVRPGSKLYYNANATELNAANGILSGGIWRVIAGDSAANLWIPMPSVLFNSAEVLLSGPGSKFGLINSLLVNSGSFSIEMGRSFQSNQASFTNEGTLSVGAGCRFSAIAAFTQPASGTLKVEIDEASLNGGLTGLVAGGTATVGGQLEIVSRPGFKPVSNQVYHIVHASPIAGRFASISAPPGFVVAVNSTDITVTYEPPCPADVDGSGSVDVGDVLAVIDAWGPCGATCPADLDADGLVGMDDLLAVISAWGACP